MKARIVTTALIVASCVWSSGLAFEAHAQEVEEDWRATHSGGRSAHVVTDADGSIYTTGTVLLDPDQNFTDYIVTIKYDLEGNTIWEREYALLPGDGFDQDANWIALDPSGNVLVTGQDNQDDFLTIKYDPDGNLLWADVNPAGYEAVRVETDAAGNVYVAGTKGEAGASFSDFVTVKYDPDGNQQWVQVYEDGFGDEVSGLAVTADGEVAVAGASSNGVSCFDMTTIRYGPDGTERWVRNYSGPLICSMDGARDVAFGPAGEVYVGGHSEQTEEGQADFTLVKYDADGNERWVRTHGGPSGLSDFINRIGVDSGGNVVVTGISESDFLTIKYDADGNQLWAQQLDFFGSTDEPDFLLIGPDDAIYLTGYATSTQSEVATVKYDAGGQLQWTATTSTSVQPDGGDHLALDATGNVVVSGVHPMFTIRYLQTQSPGGNVTVELEPESSPVVIPSTGGTVAGTATVTNGTAAALTVTLSFTYTQPSGKVKDAGRPTTLTLAAGQAQVVPFSKRIKGRAVAGTYVFTGTLSGGATAEDSFTFEKQAASEAALTADGGTDDLPNGFALGAVYPNPFHPAARFTLEVAEPQQVRVEVYNALGRRVALLHDGTLEADGLHPFVVEGTAWPSGVYVVRVTGETFVAARRVSVLR